MNSSLHRPKPTSTSTLSCFFFLLDKLIRINRETNNAAFTVLSPEACEKSAMLEGDRLEYFRNLYNLYFAATFLSVFLSFAFQAVSSLDCAPNEFNLNDVRCCTKCAPGHGVMVECNEQQDTVCEICEAGDTFSNTLSHTDACQPCEFTSAQPSTPPFLCHAVPQHLSVSQWPRLVNSII